MATQIKEWLPWKKPIEAFQDLSKYAASSLLTGVAGLILGPILSSLFGSSKSYEDALEDAVVAFGEVVRQEIEKEALRRAKVDLEAVLTLFDEMGDQIRAGGDDWWKTEKNVGGLGMKRLSHLDTKSAELVKDLKSLDLPAWAPLMAAAGMRVRILATMRMSGHPYLSETIAREVAEYVQHHRSLSAKYRDKILSVVGEVHKGALLEWTLDGADHVGDFCFEVSTGTAYEQLQSLRISQQQWMENMPPTRTMLPFTMGFAPQVVFEPQNQQEYHWHCYYHDARYYAESELPVISRRDRCLYWLWSHYNKEFVAPLEDVVLEWWKSAQIYPIGRVALTASPRGQYVVPTKSTGTLYAISNDQRSSAVFDLIHMGGNRVALRAANKMYVTANLREDYTGQVEEGQLSANRNWIKSWETFEWIRTGESEVALRAANGKYVTARPIALGILPLLRAQATSIGEMEKFRVIDLDHAFGSFLVKPPPGGYGKDVPVAPKTFEQSGQGSSSGWNRPSWMGKSDSELTPQERQDKEIWLKQIGPAGSRFEGVLDDI